MALLVRRLKVTDLPTLDGIETAQAALISNPAWLLGSRKLMERTLSEEPEGLLIADQDGEVVGWAAARQRGTHPISGLRYGHIFNISVHPKHAKKGIGSRLLRECEAYLRSRGCESIKVSMPADENAAAQMFKRGGYKLLAWELERTFKSS